MNRLGNFVKRSGVNFCCEINADFYKKVRNNSVVKSCRYEDIDFYYDFNERE